MVQPSSASPLGEMNESLLRERLRRARFARIGYVDGEQPIVVPINIAVDPDQRVAFRTAPDGPLAALDGRRVAIEIDGYDGTTRSGWSILVLGVARDVTEAPDPAATSARKLPVDTWAPGDRSRVLVVVPLSITSRTIPPSPDGDWFAGVPSS